MLARVVFFFLVVSLSIYCGIVAEGVCKRKETDLAYPNHIHIEH